MNRRKRKMNMNRVWMKRLFAGILFSAAILSASATAEAQGRYELGRTLYARRCGPCFSMGFKWAPTQEERTRPRNEWDIEKMAEEWKPSQVCTWLRQPQRKVKRPCTPGRITHRERLAILYYLTRRMEGPIRKPVMKKIVPPRARNLRFRRLTPDLRKRAVQREENRRQILKMRRRSPDRPDWTGVLAPASNRAVPRRRERQRSPEEDRDESGEETNNASSDSSGGASAEGRGEK